MWSYIYFIVLFVLKNEVLALWDEETACPLVCTCRHEHLTELAIYKHMQPEHEIHNSEANEYENNDVLYDDKFDNKHNVMLRTAICILQTETKTNKLLEELPKNVEALTLIQGFESGNKTLKFSDLTNFTGLTILELQGTKSKQVNSSIFFCEIDKQLINLKYLNLENILIKSSNRKEESQTEEVVEFVYFQKNNVHPLTLLRKIEKYDILPYDKYIEQQEKDQLPFFVGFKNLNLLIIKNCELNYIQWEMFEGLSNLEYLVLENNNLKFIPNFAFYGTPNLKLLSLAHNMLLNIQVTDLAGLLKLEYLDLSYNNFSHLSELSLPPFPNLKLANFGDNPISIVYPNTFEVMNTTASLVLGSADIPLKLQRNSFKGLKLLKKLTLKHLKIPLLKKAVFIGMPKLDELTLSGDIPEIQYDAFVEVFHLEKLILKSSNIHNLSMDAFIGLNRLKVLDLSKNQLTYLPSGVFDDLPSLEELYLNGNNFTKLPKNIFFNIHPKLIRLNSNPWHCSCKMAEWKPMITNRIKRKIIRTCDNRHDKGVGCDMESKVYYKYMYDNRVAPKCATPNKYKDLSVYPVMRRQLQCKDFRPRLKKSKPISVNKINKILEHINVTKKVDNYTETSTIINNTIATNNSESTPKIINKQENIEKLNMKLQKLKKKVKNTEGLPMKISLFAQTDNNEEDNTINNINSVSRIAENLPLSFKSEFMQVKYDRTDSNVLPKKIKKYRKPIKPTM